MPPTHVRRLTRSELRRYSRPLLVPEWQRAGAQERLGDARVLLVGAGGLGCAVAAAVAGAGVGRLRISDHDVIDISNLHRQLLFRSQDVGRAKAAVMAAQVQAINPFVQPEVVPALTPENAAELLSGVTLAIDATDNLAARYALAEAAHAAQVPCVWGPPVARRAWSPCSVVGGGCMTCFRLGARLPTVATRPACWACACTGRSDDGAGSPQGAGRRRADPGRATVDLRWPQWPGPRDRPTPAS
ncbi:ThiF family adenylyltransferase [Deinococcus radiophilus]|uniref:ThiF family adenylyltransferase n=1 Tax=Deinococcus radiophilus TaxID=32062 RepID=UPI00360C1C62